jgi:hypothetical protein
MADGAVGMQINGLDLYAYTYPDILGTPSWIAWVYFCGAPAVGNLGRRIRADLTGANGPGECESTSLTPKKASCIYHIPYYVYYYSYEYQ